MAKTIDCHCNKEADISALKTKMEGFEKLMVDNGHDGIPTVLHRIVTAMELANKRKANAWKWVIPLAVFSSTLIVTIIEDHYTLKQAPDVYVTQKVMATWLSEFQGMANALEKMASAKTVDEMKEYQKEFGKHSKTFDYMNVTRGGGEKRDTTPIKE